MKLNKKGMTMVEIIVSISLISIVLIFLMNLFVKVRGTYNQSKIQADFDVLNATIIKAIGNDIDLYGLKEVKYIGAESHVTYADRGTYSAVQLTFGEYRPSKLSEPIKKILKVYYSGNRYYVSYGYDSVITNNVTSAERLTNVVREAPEGIVFNAKHYIQLLENGVGVNASNTLNRIVEIKIPVSTEKGNIYDINIFGVIE